MKERLQKVISKAGVTSRRGSEKLIQAGKVVINGKRATQLGTKVDPTKDVIRVEGKIITYHQPKIYIVMNKPKGYLTTLHDPQKRPIVTDLLKGVEARIFPVGRLDYDTEGLLFLTNDGDLAHRLLHPSSRIQKTYVVEIEGCLSPKEVSQLERGIHLDDGPSSSVTAQFVKKTNGGSIWKVSIHEGRKRQIKRIFQKLGHPVRGLKRIKFGPLRLGKLVPGEYRFLTTDEIANLRRFIAQDRD
ncbi:MAG: pseudouridine synthase [Thermodesulfobacteriota bacterium]|nr:pseudouridine synthase [Thermodesulfobacteriota bacterium]